MSAEYLIHLPDGSTDGPFTEEDLLDLVDADELGAGSICQDTATGRRCRVRDLFTVIGPGGRNNGDGDDGADASGDEDEEKDEGGSGAAEAPASRPKAPARWVPAPFPAAEAAPGAPVVLPTRTLYTGHPSLYIYWRSLLVALGLMAGGWYAGRWENGSAWLAAGWLGGGLWLAVTLLRRSAVEYRITTRRVEAQRGLVSKSSREIRIPDIRSINVRKSGPAGLLGVGDVVFSSASGGGEDVVFHSTPGAHALKLRVRRLQDRDG